MVEIRGVAVLVVCVVNYLVTRELDTVLTPGALPILGTGRFRATVVFDVTGAAEIYTVCGRDAVRV